MNDGLKRACDTIRENSGYVDTALRRQCAIWRGEETDLPPLMLACPLTEEQSGWLSWYNTKEIHFDCEKMLVNGVLGALARESE